MADIIGRRGQELWDPVPHISLLISARSTAMHAHPDDAANVSVQSRQRRSSDPLMSLLHHQRVHNDKARRDLQRKQLHVESTVTLRTRTLVPVLPRLLLRQRSLENRPVKRLQRLRDGIQDWVTELLNPPQMSAAIVFCKLVPGLIAVRESQVIIQHVHNGGVIFKPLDRCIIHRGINFGLQCKNLLLIRCFLTSSGG